MPLLKLKVPANTNYFLLYLIEVATFDPLPVDYIWAVFDLPAKDAYSTSFENSGYEFIHSMENLGTMFVLIQIYIIISFLCFLLLCCDCRVT